jgi:hypothetical protein
MNPTDEDSYSFACEAMERIEQVVGIDFVPFLHNNGLEESFFTAVRIAYRRGERVETFAGNMVRIINKTLAVTE